MKERTLRSWQEECEKAVKSLYARHEKAWKDRNCSDKTRKYYATIAANNLSLSELLRHIVEAGGPINRIVCVPCRNGDQEHMNKMTSLFAKYKKFIEPLCQ